jgi:hypothetical protein
MRPWHINLVLGLVWVGLFRYCQLNSYPDPSSVFFDSSRAYRPTYSATRETDADTFLQQAAAGKVTSHTADGGQKYLCVGVPSLRRREEQFMGRAIASLVDKMTLETRSTMHLVVLMSDWNPTDNPAYGQKWLDAIADEVIIYGDAAGPANSKGYNVVQRDPSNHVTEDARNERVHLDYATLMDACHQQNAEYFLLMEDDVIASHDWFIRLRESLNKVEKMSSGKKKGWAYLRLFYTELYMGWNSEEWPLYLRNVLLAYLSVIGAFWGMRRVLFPSGRRSPAKSSAPISILTFDTAASLILGLWFPLFVALYFMAGRVLVNGYSAGVQEMPKYGCCAQGLAFPRRHLAGMITELRQQSFDKAGDSFLEWLADKSGMTKYAMVPPVLQHVGVRGSSLASGIRKTTWNFSFEKVYSALRR